MHLLPLLLFALAGCGGAKLDPKTPYTVLHSPLTIPLDDAPPTRVEITQPHRGKGPFPTVIFVHGKGPGDRDGTLKSPAGTTPMFKILADELTSRGFLVARYDQRHVGVDGKVDLPAYIGDQDLHTFKDDLLAVLQGLRSDPRVDGERVFLVGYDEGTQVAAAAAVEDQNIAGMVWIGASAVPFRERFESWFMELTLLYLERFAYQGKLDGALLSRAVHTRATEPVLLQSSMLGVSFTRNSTVIQPSPLVDKDRNGILSIDEEVEPAVPTLVKLAFGPLGSFGYLTEERALPTVIEQLDHYAGPVLALQGGNDAYTPPENGRAIEAKMLSLVREDQGVNVMTGHGHALGFASQPLDDLHRPISGQAREVLGDWLVAIASR